MSIALLAVVGIVLLLGLVALGLGTEGWSLGTVVAAFLVLLSAATFAFFIGRVAERERAWHDKVRLLQTDIARTREAMAPGPSSILKAIPGERSIDALEDEVKRWKRARDRAETWRGRMWEQGSFLPPRVGNEGRQEAPGMLQLDVPSDEAAELPFNPGAQVFVFDDTRVDEGGRYLGAFRVEEAAKDGEQFRFKVVAATTPTAAEAKLWSKMYESVTVFEQLPTDTWLAFSRTKQPAPAGEEPADDEAADGDTVVPPTRKQSAEQLLEKLEAQLAEAEKHDSPVAEEEWKKLVDEKKIEPGRYWATVEFTAPHGMPLKAGEEETHLAQFETGDVAEFDLDTAVGLANDQLATIKKVVYRRPLVDAGVALEGGEVSGAANAKLWALGLVARRRALEEQAARIGSETQRVNGGIEKTAETIKSVQSEESDLNADLDRWKQDVDTATEVATAFEERLAAASRALKEAWDTVVQLGREYDGSMALLQADIDKRAPAPR